jgi:transcriptional regulator with XRE-family HTH domain
LVDDINSAIMQKSKPANRGTNTLPFRQILKSVMTERNLTVRKVAELAEVKPTTVSNWLDGKNPHDLKAVDRLAKSLGISFKGLLLGEPETVGSVQNISELYQEQDFFDGLAKISIKRLIPRGEK